MRKCDIRGVNVTEDDAVLMVYTQWKVLIHIQKIQ